MEEHDCGTGHGDVLEDIQHRQAMQRCGVHPAVKSSMLSWTPGHERGAAVLWFVVAAV
jgi:hypothetical protein